MRKIINWLDNNLLAVLAGFLLVFIPLYPKLPLFDILPGYIVRVRVEDFLVGVSLVFFLFQIVRRKIPLAVTPVSIGLLSYLIAGLLSVAVSIFVVGTVPEQWHHMGKTFLHWLRRVEYFSLFFIVFGAIKSVRTVKVFVVLLFLTLFAVTIYGYGQKYLYWPAFSTMNREFAKGWLLYLTEHARVLSTFGGHYDLAGYLVIVLSLCWSFFFAAKKLVIKVLVALILAGGFWLLILTASRISFIAYLVGLAVVIFLWAFRRGLGWGISRYVVATGLSLLVMLSFGDLSDRFLRILRLDERIGGLRQVLLLPRGTPPANQAIFLENNLAAVAARSDVPPSRVRPGDVAEDRDLWPTTQTTASGAAQVVLIPRKYSQNALMFDLSTGIRLDATWPRAISAFKENPLTGTGYATLTKTSKFEFTEAESTDNDYLRSLGETGLLGFLTFFGSLTIMGVLAFRALGGIKDNFIFALVSGFLAFLTGLLVNAMYIDIFEASKVAYVFWGVSGLTMGTVFMMRDKIKADYAPLRIKVDWTTLRHKIGNFFRSDVPWVGLVLALALAVRLYKFDGPVADWHSWRQADTSAVTRDFVRTGINWLYPTYDDLSSVASGKPNLKGLRLVEFPIYSAAAATVKRLAPEFTVEEAGRVTTIAASLFSALFLFLLSRELFSRRIAYLTALTYSLLPYSIYYSRVILPDPSMVATALGALWFALKYVTSEKKKFLLFSLVLAVISLLIKPFAVFLLVPIGYLLFLDPQTANWRSRIARQLIFWSIALLPLLLWRLWISQFPEGIPASSWLYNGDGIRFKGAFWYWLFADRIGRLILGYWGLVLLGIGLIRPIGSIRKYRLFPVFYLLSAICYLLIFATGNVRHDYYQILLVPSLAIVLALGLDYLLSLGWRGRMLAVVSSLFMLGFGWYFVRDYYNVNHPEIIAAGAKLQEFTRSRHERALIVAPYDGDTAFLYQTNHKGWPIVEKSIPDLIKMGADYYVSVRSDALTSQLLAESETAEERLLYPKRPRKPYTLLARTDQYAIIQLVSDKELPGN